MDIGIKVLVEKDLVLLYKLRKKAEQNPFQRES
jgi:hypothetical protein